MNLRLLTVRDKRTIVLNSIATGIAEIAGGDRTAIETNGVFCSRNTAWHEDKDVSPNKLTENYKIWSRIPYYESARKTALDPKHIQLRSRRQKWPANLSLREDQDRWCQYTKL